MTVAAPQRTRTWRAELALLLGFGAITAGLLLPAVQQLDLAVRDLADAHRPAAAQTVAEAVNRLGSGGLLTTVAAALAVVVAFRHRSWRPLALVGAAFLMTGVVLWTLKELIDRAAPHATGSGGMSYPSGHAVNTIVWYGVLCTLLALKAPVRTWIRLLPPVVVTLAGVYLGFHWLTDMLAGLCLGLLLDRLLARAKILTIMK